MKSSNQQNTNTGNESGNERSQGNRNQGDVQISRQGSKEERPSTGFPTVFNSFFGDDFPSLFNLDFPSFGRISRNLPAVNIRERRDDFVIDVAVPGMTKENFDITIDNNVLQISAEANYKRSEEEESYTRREFQQTSFSRYFTLPDSVDPDKIDAKYTDGVLCITLPKKEEAKAKPPKQIRIS
jgi:HSP20 family protein